MHRIHIGDDIWKWYVTRLRGPIVVFSPFGKRHEVSIGDYARFTGMRGSDFEINCACDERSYPTVTPAEVKRYIFEKLVLTK